MSFIQVKTRFCSPFLENLDEFYIEYLNSYIRTTTEDEEGMRIDVENGFPSWITINIINNQREQIIILTDATWKKYSSCFSLHRLQIGEINFIMVAKGHIIFSRASKG